MCNNNGGETEKNSLFTKARNNFSKAYTVWQQVFEFRYSCLVIFKGVKKFVTDREIVDVKFNFGFASFKIRQKTKE